MKIPTRNQMAAAVRDGHPELDKLRELTAEAGPHVEKLTAALAVARHEHDELLPIVQRYFGIMASLEHRRSLGEIDFSLDETTRLDVHALRPVLAVLRQFLHHQKCIAEWSSRGANYSRAHCYTPNGRKA